MIEEVEKYAGDVLDAHEIKDAPVDVLKIAKKERIKLCPLHEASGGFCGRLEYHPDLGRFLLFYPTGVGFPQTRVNFSIGHELGHFFIPHHREAMMRGETHNSESGFICEKPMEREADSFSAALLMPGKTIESRLRSKGFLSLDEVVKLGDNCKTSRESTAIRYAKFTEEPCVVVLSEDGVVRYSVPSDEARANGCWIPKGSELPPSAVSRSTISTNKPNQRGEDSKIWFPRMYRDVEVWEKAIALGYCGLVLTIVSWESRG